MSPTQTADPTSPGRRSVLQIAMNLDDRTGEAAPTSSPSQSAPSARDPWSRRRIAIGAGVVVVVVLVALILRPRPDPEALWRQAQEALAANKIDEAARLSGRLARLRPPLDRDVMLRAQVALARDRPDEALEILESIPDSSMLAPQARLLAGQIELRRDRFRLAEESFHRALELDPTLDQARRELIYIYGYRTQSDAIEEQFRNLAGRGPVSSDEAFLWSLVRGVQWTPEEIVDMLSRAIRSDPEDHRSRIALADALMELSRLDEAAAVLEPLDPDDPDARRALGRLALERGDVPRLAELLAAAPEDHAGLARLRGKLALQRRDPERAIAAFRKALELRPYDRDALSGLSQALNQAGRRAEAAEAVEQLNRVNALNDLLNQQAKVGASRTPEDLVALGVACEAIGLRHQARAWYLAAIADDPFHREAQQALARLDEPADEADGGS